MSSISPPELQIDPHSIQPAAVNRNLKYLGVTFGIFGVVALVTIACLFVLILFQLNLNSPIRGVETRVEIRHTHPSQAENQNRIKKRAQAALHRGLRTQGYRRFNEPTWKVEAHLIKTSTQPFIDGGQVITIDKLAWDIRFLNTDDRIVHTMKIPVDLANTTQLNAGQDAQSQLVRLSYDLAVKKLKTANYPPPSELESRALPAHMMLE